MDEQTRRHTAQIVQDAAWLAHRYDPAGDCIHFIPASREAYDAATFLTDEYLPQAQDPVVIQREDAIVVTPSAAPLHFIFHSAYCCSTLLARAFNIPGVSMGLKEPVVLNDIIGWRHRGGTDGSALDSRRVAMVLDHAMRLLERPFASGEAVIVKPSNIVNPLAPVMLAMRPQSKAVLLYTPLEAYIGSIARKGMWGRHWVRDLLVKLLREGVIDLGFEDRDYLTLTDLQVAAVGWLAQHAQFAAWAERFGAARIATLNSDVLTAHPAATLEAVARHYGLGVDTALARTIADGPVFGHDAKTGKDFAPSQRKKDRDDALSVHGEEIAMVMEWAKVLAHNAKIAFDLPGALDVA